MPCQDWQSLCHASLRKAKAAKLTTAWRLCKQLNAGDDAGATAPAMQRRLAHRTRIHRADEGDDLPQLVAGLDDAAEGRHRSDHDLLLDAVIALLPSGRRSRA